MGQPVRCARTDSSVHSLTGGYSSSARWATRMSRSVQGRPAQSAPQVMLRGRTTPAGVAVAASPAGLPGRLAGGAVGHPRQQREVHAVGEHRGLARVERDQEPVLRLGHVHRRAHGLAVVRRGQPVGDLHRRVLDDVGDEAIRDLLGDDEALAVGADLGQQPGEHLHRVRRRPRRSAGFLAAEQPVRLLDDGQVAQPGRCGQPGPAGHPQVLGQPDQDRSHQEGLVAVVADVLDLQHGIAGEQRAEVELMAALQEPAGGPEAQAGQPDLDEAEHVVGDPLAVADLPDDPDRGPLQVGQARVAGIGVRRDRLA